MLALKLKAAAVSHLKRYADVATAWLALWVPVTGQAAMLCTASESSCTGNRNFKMPAKQVCHPPNDVDAELTVAKFHTSSGGAVVHDLSSQSVSHSLFSNHIGVMSQHEIIRHCIPCHQVVLTSNVCYDKHAQLPAESQPQHS